MSAARANKRREDPALLRQRRRQRLRLLRRALAGAGLALGAGAGLFLLNQALDVRDWTIQAPPALKREIEHAMQRWTARDFWHARPAAVAAMLKRAAPDIARIEVRRVLPHGLLIRAEARRAIALWAAPEGGLRLLDAEGEPWRAPRSGEAPDLPLVHAARARLASACALLLALRKSDPARLARISEIRSDAHGWRMIFDRGEAWRLPEAGAAKRIAAIERLLQKPRWRRMRWRVDARAEERWFLRPAAHEGVI